MADRGAPAAEPFGHVGRGRAPASLIPQVGESDADSVDLLVHRVPPIATFVSPLLVLRVRCSSVHFYARPIIRVEVIEVSIAGLLPDPGLAFRRWQAVRSLDTPDVSEFKQGEGPFGRVAERELDVAPPADSRARVQRFAYPVRGGAPASDRAADPVVCLIEAS